MLIPVQLIEHRDKIIKCISWSSVWPWNPSLSPGKKKIEKTSLGLLGKFRYDLAIK
jgi:hypothetical protein